MTVRPRWWLYAIMLVVFAPAILLATRGEWTPLLLLLAPGLAALLLIVAIVAWSRYTDDA